MCLEKADPLWPVLATESAPSSGASHSDLLTNTWLAGAGSPPGEGLRQAAFGC